MDGWTDGWRREKERRMRRGNEDEKRGTAGGRSRRRFVANRHTLSLCLPFSCARGLGALGASSLLCLSVFFSPFALTLPLFLSFFLSFSFFTLSPLLSPTYHSPTHSLTTMTVSALFGAFHDPDQEPRSALVICLLLLLSPLTFRLPSTALPHLR